MNKKLILFFSFLIILPGCLCFSSKKECCKKNEINVDKCINTENIKESEVSKNVSVNNLNNNLKNDNSIISANDIEIQSFDEPSQNPIENINFSELNDVQEEKYLDKNNSLKYGFETIYYDFDKRNIKKSEKQKAQKNLELAKDLISKGNIIVLEGHACNSAGTPSYNLVLSEDRANNVAKYLKENGIDKSNIIVVARGDQMPIVPFGDKDQQAPNRRVEFYAYKKEDIKNLDKLNIKKHTS